MADAIEIVRREGAIIVVDPQTGQVQAAVNPDLAQQSFPPGSTIKPFPALLPDITRAHVRNQSREIQNPSQIAKR